MNEIVSIPETAVLEITSADMEYFISILNTGGFLSAANAPYVNDVLEVPDQTFFIPNSVSRTSRKSALFRKSS
jgi:hypothetical protein